MASDLWTKFKSAVRFGWEDGPAAVVATMRGSAATSFTELLAATSTTGVQPALATDGINVEGLATIDLTAMFSTAGSSAEFRFWLWNGIEWAAPESTKTITAPAGLSSVYVEPLDVESFGRVFAELVTVSAGTVALKGGPFNDEA